MPIPNIKLFNIPDKRAYFGDERGASLAGDGAAELARKGLAVKENVGGIQGDIVPGYIPDSQVLTAAPPGVLNKVIGHAVLVNGLAEDEHNVVISELPAVPLGLAKFLAGHNAVRAGKPARYG